MINIYINNFSELYNKLVNLPATAGAALAAQSQLLVDSLAQSIRNDKLSGEVLNEKTGLLKDSIATALESDGNSSKATVYVDGDVPYAAIQEYGGRTKAHIIEATQGKALAFNWSGKQAFFAHVNHPGSDIPERSYLRSALEDNADDIVSGLGDALGEAINS